MQITKQDIKNLRKGMGLTAHDITKIFDCTEKTVYNKEKPADEPADLVWYYALRWIELGRADVRFESITISDRLIPQAIIKAIMADGSIVFHNNHEATPT